MKNWGNFPDPTEFLILQGTRGRTSFGRSCSEKNNIPTKKNSVDDDLQQVIEEMMVIFCLGMAS